MSELATDGIPVAVSRRVLVFAVKPRYRLLADTINDSKLVRACNAISLCGAHGDEPELGYRFRADSSDNTEQGMARRAAWQIWSTNV